MHLEILIQIRPILDDVPLFCIDYDLSRKGLIFLFGAFVM